jgi:polyisoprenoid-binding protein YceI
MIKKIIFLSLFIIKLFSQNLEIKENSIRINAKGEFAFVENEFTITGNGLKGYVNVDEKIIYFEYDLWNLQTGIRLRDEHMHSNYLETEDYPIAIYDATFTYFDQDSVHAEGTFKLHGKEKIIIAKGQIKKGSISASFILKLTDFNIEIPRKFSIAKLSEKLIVNIKAELTEKK